MGPVPDRPCQDVNGVWWTFTEEQWWRQHDDDWLPSDVPPVVQHQRLAV